MIDTLSDVVRSVRLTGGVFLESRFTAPWCVNAGVTAEEWTPYLSAPAQVIAYHFIIGGRALLSLGDAAPIEVGGGEIVLLPRNDIHVLASAPGLTPVNARDLVQPSAGGGLATIAHGGGGETTHIVCGFLCTEQAYNPLIATLPSVVKLDVRQAASRGWIEASVRFAASELASGRVATSDVLWRLSELLLVEAIREYSATFADDEAGWLKGIKDPCVGRALTLMHQNIGAPWSAESLAREVAMSRSAFMERFRTLIGMPPIRYLTVRRLQTAKRQLRETAQTVSQLAHSVGYESEEAFSRAFKREYGLSPMRWRVQQMDG